jgi:hypothetical protein
MRNHQSQQKISTIAKRRMENVSAAMRGNLRAAIN